MDPVGGGRRLPVSRGGGGHPFRGSARTRREPRHAVGQLVYRRGLFQKQRRRGERGRGKEHSGPRGPVCGEPGFLRQPQPDGRRGSDPRHGEPSAVLRAGQLQRRRKHLQRRDDLEQKRPEGAGALQRSEPDRRVRRDPGDRGLHCRRAGSGREGPGTGGHGHRTRRSPDNRARPRGSEKDDHLPKPGRLVPDLGILERQL